MYKIQIKSMLELQKVAKKIEANGDMHIDDDVFIIGLYNENENMRSLCGQIRYVNEIDEDGNVKVDGWNLTPSMYTRIADSWYDIIEDYDVILIDRELGESETAVYLDGVFYFHDRDFKAIDGILVKTMFDSSVTQVFRTADPHKTCPLQGNISDFDMLAVWERDELEYVEVECYLTGEDSPIFAVTTKAIADQIDMTKNAFVSIVDISEGVYDVDEMLEASEVAGVVALTPVASQKGYNWQVGKVIKL